MSRPHWLAPAAATWLPPVVLSFDTETREEASSRDLVLRPRCWAAVLRARPNAKAWKPGCHTYSGTDMAALAALVDEVGNSERETWVIAHNLGLDLTVSALPSSLTTLGWTLQACGIGEESCWFRFDHDGHRLVLTDTWSWLRCSLQDVAGDLRRHKLTPPADDDDDEAFLRRCRRNTELLDEAFLVLCDWWERNDLGRFGLTGASCGWAAMRKLTRPRSICVGGEYERTALERKAIYGGRAEAFQVGRFTGTWIADYDFLAAYPTLAANIALPVGPGRSVCLPGPAGSSSASVGIDVIARVEVSTEVPLCPVRVADVIYWPTGTFRTVLCGPELRYVTERASRVQVLEVVAYPMSKALSDWAAWCLGLVTGFDSETPPLVRRMAKGWSRSVLGRFASRTSRIIDRRPTTTLGWHLTTGADLDDGTRLDYLSVDGTELVIAKDVEPAEGLPAVFAFVEAATRVALGLMLERRRPDRVLSCNTDGWIERRAVARRDYQVPGVPWPLSVTRKACHREIEVIGPAHLLMPGDRRLAGIATEASEIAPGAYGWHDWPSLRWQLQNGNLGQFTRPVRDAWVSGPYARRWVLTTGETVPPTCRLDANGGNELLAWPWTKGRREADELAEHQDEGLAGLTDLAPRAPALGDRESIWRLGRRQPPNGRQARSVQMPFPTHPPCQEP